MEEVNRLEDGSTTNKSEEVADILNTYFVIIREKIVSSVMNQFYSRIDKHFSSYLQSFQINLISLAPISQFEITKTVFDVNPCNSAGTDGFTSIIVKEMLSAVVFN